MNSFLTKLAMLLLFSLAVTCVWFAITTSFSLTLYNILLGILGAFFLFRALEIADKVNKFGPYAEKEEDRPNPQRPGHHNNPGPRFGEGSPGEDDMDLPDEE